MSYCQSPEAPPASDTIPVSADAYWTPELGELGVSPSPPPPNIPNICDANCAVESLKKLDTPEAIVNNPVPLPLINASTPPAIFIAGMTYLLTMLNAFITAPNTAPRAFRNEWPVGSMYLTGLLIV